MRYLSLFSGIEGASVAWHPLGWECAGVSEIEPFPCAVIAHHYPTIPNLGDVTKITEEDIAALGRIDLVVFGSPCQDLSVAGLRKGFICESTDTLTRSGLFFVAMRIVAWARKHNGCRFALWENVPGSFSSSQGRDFAAVVGAMAGLEDVPVPPRGWGNEGVAVGSEGLVEWATLDAQWFGVAQRRRRVFALADFGNWSNRPPILLEPESLRRDTAPRREAGKDTATEPGSCLDVSRIGTLTAGFVNAASGAKQGLEDQHVFQGAGLFAPGVTHSLRGEGFDASKDGTGRGTPLVPVSYAIQAGALRTNPASGPDGVGVQESIAYTIEARAEVQAVAFAQNSRDEVRLMNGDGQIVGALSAEPGMKQTCYVAQPVGVTIHGTDPTVQKVASYDDLAQCLRARTPGNIDNSSTTVVQQPVGAQMSVPQVDFDLNQTLQAKNPMAVAVSLRGREGGATAELGDEVGNCLRASGGGVDKAHVLTYVGGVDYENNAHTMDQPTGPLLKGSPTGGGRPLPAIATAMQVRRLTPVECARLQGFPDDYLSQVTWRGKSPPPDGPMYKALGNSWATPVVQWIGRRIHNATRRSK